MSKIMKIHFFINLKLMMVFLSVPVWAQNYEAYYNYIGNYPHNREITMSEQIQGVTHDDKNWFFTQRETIWKIPVDLSLNTDRTCSDSRIDCTFISDVPELSGYNHFGDPSYYWYIDEGYLFVPTEYKNNSKMDVIAVFAASDLSFIDMVEVHAAQENHASWCSIIPDIPGLNNRNTVYLYSTKWENVGSLVKYKVNMSALRNKGNGKLDMEFVEKIPLNDEAGEPYGLDYVQGGVFTLSGELLYLINGNCQDDCDCGIHVFKNEGESFRIVNRSSQSDHPFKFEYHPRPSCHEEPEGVTIWDLDDDKAPYIKGQLHVILLVDDYFDQDQWYFKHYSGTIYVDGVSGGSHGTFDEPFNTLNEAINYAWDGSKIKIKGGSYPEAVTFSKQVEVSAYDGNVVVGH